MGTEKREGEIRVRATATERERWKRAATAEGRTLSSFIRHAADLFAARALRKKAER